MKTLKRWLPPLAALLLCGCFQAQDELTLEADGSGKVTLTLHSSLPEEVIGMMGSGFGPGTPAYPPINEAQARRCFPPKDFTLKVDEKSSDDGKTIVIVANFKNVNALLASPYGSAHQLSLQTNAGILVLRALSGGSTLAQAAQFKPEGEMASFNMPGFEEAQKKKGEMRFELRVVLPNSASATNGIREGKSVTWAVERAKCQSDDEFAGKLGKVLEANCSANGLKFWAVTPPRLGLLPFPQLAAGKSGLPATLPDTNKIAKVARFIPCALHVTRSLDLSGEGSVQGSQAQLTGVVLLPAEYVPQQWGQAKLEEALDAKGNNLLPKDASDSAMAQMAHFGSYDLPDEMDEEDQDETAPRPEDGKPRLLTLSFKAPDWKVKEITRIKGVIELQYLGETEVIKLTNAVPASLVMGASMQFAFGSNTGPGRGLIAHPRLRELGLSLQVQTAMVESGMTMLTLETGGGKGRITDVQVFDSEGHAWPTTLTDMDASAREQRSCEIMVSGKPKPPLSLAIAVTDIGASVGVPILVENVPVRDN